MFEQTHVWFSKILRGCLVASLLVASSGLVLTQKGCSCDPPPVADAGPEPVPEASGPFPTKIRFVQPVAQSIISGQIPIEVEVIDGDGIEEVQFLINGKPHLTETTTSKNTTKESPRYEVQVATSFLPRGVMHLTVRTLDKLGDKEEKTIQVTTRERWVAAFGIGQVKQLLVRKDRHMYLRVYRSEQDISRVTNPGPFDQVGAAIITGNSVGANSWIFLGLGEEFSEMTIDDAQHIYFGSRLSEKGTNRLLSIGPGDSKWTPEIPVKPVWETDLQEWSVKNAPALQGDGLWIHLEKPAQGPEPAVSVLARFAKTDGTESWRYAGTTPQQILRGPFLFANGQALIFARDAKSPDAGFSAQLIDRDGKLAWEQSYPELRLNVVLSDEANQRLYLGLEKRAGKDVVSSALVCIDPAGKKECWRKDYGKSWPDQFSLGTSTLFVLRHPEGGALEVVAVNTNDGSEKWAKEYKKYNISGIYATPKDECLVFGVSLDDFQDPVNMYIERYDAAGALSWKYENKQFYPLNWQIASDGAETLWVIVRNIEDKREQLGNKLLSLNEKGERLFLFFEESRKHQFMQYFSKDVLYLTSSDSRNVRVHNLLAR